MFFKKCKASFVGCGNIREATLPWSEAKRDCLPPLFGTRVFARCAKIFARGSRERALNRRVPQPKRESSTLCCSINWNLFISFYKSQVRDFLRFPHKYRPEGSPCLLLYQSICHRIHFQADYRDRSAYRQEISLFVR